MKIGKGYDEKHEFMFFCPGCQCAHWFNTKVWTYNGNAEKPTIRASILMTGKRDITDEEADRIMKGEKLDIPEKRCHSFVTDGMIRFLDDCTHDMKGQTVELPEWGSV